MRVLSFLYLYKILDPSNAGQISAVFMLSCISAETPIKADSYWSKPQKSQPRIFYNLLYSAVREGRLLVIGLNEGAAEVESSKCSEQGLL